MNQPVVGVIGGDGFAVKTPPDPIVGIFIPGPLYGIDGLSRADLVGTDGGLFGGSGMSFSFRLQAAVPSGEDSDASGIH
jgi:hypothetical protein